MDLELLLFASLKDDVGSPTLRLTIPEGSTVSNLLQEIGESHPYLAEAFATRNLAAIPLLVTTEHSARGMDFKGVDTVFIVGLPARLDSYIHVAGRTARAGRGMLVDTAPQISLLHPPPVCSELPFIPWSLILVSAHTLLQEPRRVVAACVHE